jgi:gliding motility-associated-like protein
VGIGTYNLVVTDENGCTAQAEIVLHGPFALEMPTVITDNGDGKNDMFVVHGIESYPDNTLQVFNRWGNLVYQKDNYDNQWSGANKNGQPLPEGTYFVILTLDGVEPMNGYVEIKR